MLFIQLYRLMCDMDQICQIWEQRVLLKTMSKVTSILIFRLKREETNLQFHFLYCVRVNSYLKKDNSINNTIRRFDSFCSTLTRMYVAAQRCLTLPSMLIHQFVDNFSQKQMYLNQGN